MNSLRDRVYPVTPSSNASECDVTFERYCNVYITYDDHEFLHFYAQLNFLTTLVRILWDQQVKTFKMDL